MGYQDRRNLLFLYDLIGKLHEECLIADALSLGISRSGTVCNRHTGLVGNTIRKGSFSDFFISSGTEAPP